MVKVKDVLHEKAQEIKADAREQVGFSPVSPPNPSDDYNSKMEGGEKCGHKNCEWTASENHQAVETDEHLTRSHQSELIQHMRDEHNGVLPALCVCRHGADECREKEYHEIGNEEEIS